ncbi:MAG: type II toxin-antitoxin system HicA family toxin [Methanobacteriota archaeon]|nr:type II toxin-antitoxin system HicA family toxin [Candidatus Thermoplasmatota archaeon]
MPKLPVVTGDKVIKAFSKVGWSVARQRGSHVIMVKENSVVTLSIPVHKNRPVKRGLLRDLIRDAGLTVEQFCELL